MKNAVVLQLGSETDVAHSHSLSIEIYDVTC